VAGQAGQHTAWAALLDGQRELLEAGQVVLREESTRITRSMRRFRAVVGGGAAERRAREKYSLLDSFPFIQL
jgi:hypothetical protein